MLAEELETRRPSRFPWASAWGYVGSACSGRGFSGRWSRRRKPSGPPCVGSIAHRPAACRCVGATRPHQLPSDAPIKVGTKGPPRPRPQGEASKGSNKGDAQGEEGFFSNSPFYPHRLPDSGMVPLLGRLPLRVALRRVGTGKASLWSM